MPGRTTKQVRRRWTDTIDPRIRKGYFTKTEDTILSTARFYHKLNFRQIARLLPGRTPNQLRCRYTRLEFVNPVHPWCL
jgi:Myb-like DNA-binding protein BAS1